ncbi:MAG: transcription antitermination factor NusB [Deltaproteobacteria bacterium]|nr:MAG: transcription antitermination factor NusB [Deltaproteobacteria bacterium]
MGTRRLARELAVQVLFHLELNPGDPDEAFDLVCQNFQSPQSQASNQAFSRQLVLGVCRQMKDLDEMIRNASQNWRLERMPCLDRCVLRLASFEILCLEDIPPKVSIDEALEIGKKFGSEHSGPFINGVLDNIYNTLVEQGKLTR